ncbi:ABC transporter ATP-binding protein [Patulibacter sp.]|uniref:ABC transporter ATP-binding protein n=1 Tax=Patulibacter sp. TaxID=1912859 RepID=UPI0027162887|nr:ABC transporter ATP-binding protein [Patulibacter sp.]MDO9410847.1 ABC transporter ATP-binding protein [Patulibacter sp.]
MSAVEQVAPGTPAPPAAPVLRAEGLRRTFGTFVAVDDVSIELRPGRVTALIGPNGAGKSTVINLLAGTLIPTAGQVRIADVRVEGLRAEEVALRGLARTFQTPKLYEGMTVLDMVMLARDRFGRASFLEIALRTPRTRRDRRASHAAAMAHLERVGLAHQADRLATSLPVGSQRLVDVARALASEPDVLLLDEPAAGLDHTETHDLTALIREIAAEGLAVLLVEHDMRMVMSIADDVVVLDRGRLLAAGTPKEVAADPAVIEAYLGTVAA